MRPQDAVQQGAPIRARLRVTTAEYGLEATPGAATTRERRPCREVARPSERAIDALARLHVALAERRMRLDTPALG